MTVPSQLETEIATLIVETLKLEDVSPTELEPDLALFGEGGLEFNSIDALEIGIAVQKKFGIEFEAQDEDVQKSFATVGTLASFIESKNQVGNSSKSTDDTVMNKEKKLETNTPQP